MHISIVTLPLNTVPTSPHFGLWKTHIRNAKQKEKKRKVYRMASWTRAALALLAGTVGARKHVEMSHPLCLRISARHVMAWFVLQKKRTRMAIRQAKGLGPIVQKMIEITVAGGRVTAHHVAGVTSVHPLKAGCYAPVCTGALKIRIPFGDVHTAPDGGNTRGRIQGARKYHILMR